MRYVEARLKREMRDETYRIYISDSIYYATRRQGLNMRYSELTHPRDKKAEMSGDDLALAVIRNAGLNYLDDRGE